MPLDFKDLQEVGIQPELVALTEADDTPVSQEGPEEVQVRGGTDKVHQLLNPFVTGARLRSICSSPIPHISPVEFSMEESRYETDSR